MNQLDTLLPITALESLRRLHDVITLVLRGTSEDLTVGVIEHSSESSRNDLLLEEFGIVVALGHERDFEKHGRDEVGDFEEFEVDVHVEGKLTLSFSSFLFGGEDRVSLSLNTLSEEFLDSLSGEDLLKGRLSFSDETKAESAETNLNDGSVVKDLGVDIGVSDGVLKMRHEEHVTSGVVIVVEGVVVDVGKHGSGSEEGVVGLVEVNAESANEGDGGEFAR